MKKYAAKLSFQMWMVKIIFFPNIGFIKIS